MIVAGYITASTVDLVLVRRVKGGIQLYNHATYDNREFPQLDSILKLYLKKIKNDVNQVCLGIAGPIINNEVTTTNLPWHISGRDIESEFGITSVKLMNDLVATAHGLFQLPADKLIRLNIGHPMPDGHIGLLAAGNGLGESLIYCDHEKHYPYASEGGHADFAPSNQLETDLWEYLYAEKGQVEVEDVVSFSGIDNIYNFLLSTSRVKPAAWYQKATDCAAKITEMALAGKDETAVKTLDIFVDCYASEAANLALKGMTMGGVYLGGATTKQIMTAIDKAKFMERFVKKGKMQAFLDKVPVNLIIDEKTALLGAAAVALEKAGA